MSVSAVQVVYIDSDPHMHQALAKVLLALGVSFRCYRSYEEARELLKAAPPHVVFCDLNDYQQNADCQLLASFDLALVTPHELSESEAQFVRDHQKRGRHQLARPLDRHEIAHYLSVTLYKDTLKAA